MLKNLRRKNGLRPHNRQRVDTLFALYEFSPLREDHDDVTVSDVQAFTKS